MKAIRQYFQGKKIIVMGLGLLGRSVNDVRFLAECGADLLVTDLKSKSALKESLRKLKKYRGIKYILGRHRLKDFQNRDMILKSAGIPLDSVYIKEARKHKISVEMDESLFAKLSPATIIGVTGTKGKTTISYLIYEILKKAGKRVFLSGNIIGRATLPLLPKVKKGDLVILELSSWQLQGFGDSQISPPIAVFSNFTKDHLNYYSGNLKKYFKDKSYIYKFQTESDYLIVGPSLGSRIKTRGNKVIAGPEIIPKNWKLKLLGKHNLANVALAMKVAEILGTNQKVIKKAVEEFVGIPDRLELVRKVRGVSYYNDTTATIPESVIAALKALATGNRNIILIAGGEDKRISFRPLVKEMRRSVKALILLKGTATRKIIKLLSKKEPFLVFRVSTMKEAVARAKKLAVGGDSVLLSPGAASFGRFKNEYDRGEQFRKLVKKIK